MKLDELFNGDVICSEKMKETVEVRKRERKEKKRDQKRERD